MKSQWFAIFNKKPNPGMKLFCFPYAGGNAATFAKWHEQLAEHIEVLALQTPGRASRLMETPIDNMDELTTRVAQNMLPLIAGDYAILGHSLGAKVAFEVSLKLLKLGVPAPTDFIASACAAPSVKRTQATIYHLAEKEFVAELRAMGGTPEAVLQNNALRAMCLPAIRADFKMVETYQGSQEQLNTRAHVLYGLDDHSIALESVSQWQEHFSRSTKLYPVQGDHFYIDHQQREVLDLVNDILS